VQLRTKAKFSGTHLEREDRLMAIMIVWEPRRNRQRCASEEEAMTKIRRAVPDAQPEPTWTQAADGTTSIKHVWRVHGGRTVKVASLIDTADDTPQPQTQICPPSNNEKAGTWHSLECEE
jgi:hypothetical protein